MLAHDRALSCEASVLIGFFHHRKYNGEVMKKSSNWKWKEEWPDAPLVKGDMPPPPAGAAPGTGAGNDAPALK
jgi:hypothetical protein